MTFFFPQHSSLFLFLQLCRFTSLSLPPICACPAHASLPFLHFYQSLSCLHVLSPAHTHTLHHFPRWTISTCMSSFVLTLHFCWKHTEHHSTLYPNSIQTHLSILKLHLCLLISYFFSISPSLLFWLDYYYPLNGLFCSDDSAFWMNI